MQICLYFITMYGFCKGKRIGQARCCRVCNNILQDNLFCERMSISICRYHKLAETGFFNENHIDAILIFGGTNDSWCQVPIGEEKYSDWEKEDLFSALPAICYFIDVLKKDHPDKRIIFLINCDSIKTEIIECIKNASKRIGIEFVELKNIDKLTKHPTVTGMEQIYCQLMAYLKSQD